jgi:hypothetical protein
MVRKPGFATSAALAPRQAALPPACGPTTAVCRPLKDYVKR